MTVVKARVNNQWVAMADGNVWDTAWGIVAVGSFIGGSTYSLPVGVTKITPDLTFKSVVGRRYRMVLQIRIIGPTTGNGVNFLPLGSGVGGSTWDTWFSSPGPWDPLYTEVLFVGNGVAGAYYWNANNAGTGAVSMYLDSMSTFYIEDVGPVASAAVQSLVTPWIQVTTFTNGWSNNDASGSNRPASYRKIGDEVQLRGLVKGGTIQAGAFTLPPAYCPINNFHFPIISDPYKPEVGVAFTDGRIAVWTGSTLWSDLGGIRFSTTPGGLVP